MYPVRPSSGRSIRDGGAGAAKVRPCPYGVAGGCAAARAVDADAGAVAGAPGVPDPGSVPAAGEAGDVPAVACASAGGVCGTHWGMKRMTEAVFAPTGIVAENPIDLPGSRVPLETPASAALMICPLSSTAATVRRVFRALVVPRFRSVPRTIRLSPFFVWV